MSYRLTGILRVSERESSNPELHFSDGGAGLASLAAVCSFEHLSHGGTTLAFHPGCYFKARMPLFLMLTKFVRAALGWGYGRLRGRPSHPELCFNGLSHHQLIISLQVAMRESFVSQHMFLYHSSHICLSLFLLLSLIFLTSSITLSLSFALHLVLSYPPPPPPSSKPHCLGPLVLAKLLPHEDSLIVVIRWQKEPRFQCAENMCHCFSGQTERQAAPGGDGNHGN